MEDKILKLLQDNGINTQEAQMDVLVKLLWKLDKEHGIKYSKE